MNPLNKLQSDISVLSVSILQFILKIHLLWLDAVKNLLKCNSSVFDTIQVDKHQETCEKDRKPVKTLTLKTKTVVNNRTGDNLHFTGRYHTPAVNSYQLKGMCWVTDNVRVIKSSKHNIIVSNEMIILTLDELGGFGALEPLEEQNEDLFPVLCDRFSAKRKRNLVKSAKHHNTKPINFTRYNVL